MYKIRLAALCLVTAALGAGAAGASAHEFLVNGTAIAPAEKIEVQGNVIAVQTEGILAGASIHTTCQEGVVPAASNLLEEKGKVKIKIEYKACTISTVNAGVVENLPKCKLASFNIEGSGELTEAGVVSIKGSPFATLKIEENGGACTLKGEFKEEGTVLCSIPDYSVTGNLALLVCTPTGSTGLKEGTEPAKLYLTTGLYAAKGQTLSSN